MRALVYHGPKSYTGFCPTANPDTAGAAYGYADMGPYNGGQAELLRVPWADCRPGRSDGRDVRPVAWRRRGATGQANVKQYNCQLRNLIHQDKLHPASSCRTS